MESMVHVPVESVTVHIQKCILESFAESVSCVYNISFAQ